MTIVKATMTIIIVVMSFVFVTELIVSGSMMIDGASESTVFAASTMLRSLL